MKGKEIIDAVRLLLNEENYSTYFDINRAHRYLCSLSNHRFVRKSSIELVFFNPESYEYSLSMRDVDELEAIYYRGGVNSGNRVASVQDKDLSSPPTTEVPHGVRYIVAASPTGGWAGYTAGQIATYDATTTSWSPSTPSTNDTLLVEDEDRHYTYSDGAWSLVVTSTVGWTPLEEVSTRKFEEMRAAYTNKSTTLLTQAEPRYYKWIGGASATLAVTPTPDDTYDIRVDYVARPADITADTQPLLPLAFHDMLVTLSAAFALQRRSTPADITRGDRFFLQVQKDVKNLLNFSSRNKQSIDRKPRALVR